MFILTAVFFAFCLLIMEFSALGGLNEIAYWKWCWVGFCTAGALMSSIKNPAAEPLAGLALIGCSLADLFLLFTLNWQTGIALFCLVQLCLSFILIQQERWIQLCLALAGIIFISALVLKLPKIFCLCLFYAVQTGFNVFFAGMILLRKQKKEAHNPQIPSLLSQQKTRKAVQCWTAGGTFLLALCDLNVILFQFGMIVAGGWIWPFYIPALFCFTQAARKSEFVISCRFSLFNKTDG